MPSSTLPSGALRKMPLWKRLALVGASFGAGIGIVGTVAGLSVYWYYSHPRATRDWPERDIEAYGLKASLKTRWRDDALHYRLDIAPLSPDGVDAFDRSFRSFSEPLNFTLFLYDDAGFQVCSASIDKSDIKHDVDKKGRFASLSVNATWLFCSYGRYRDSRKWNLGWKVLPKVSTDRTDTAPSAPVAATNKAPKTEKPMTIEGTDTITGVDPVSSQLDTESGRVFWVYRPGEQYTVISWSAKERLRFSCKTRSDCIVVNTDRDETVHARLTK